jgi:dihydroorotase
VKRTTALLVAALTALPAGSQEIYDVILKGGHIIDPKNKRNERLDIAITANKVRRVAKTIPVVQGRMVVDVGDYYVTPGLIDIHTHIDAQGAPLSVNPDHNTLRFGVTTAVDAGSSGWKTFEQFNSNVIAHSTVRILAFLNIAGEDRNSEAVAKLASKYPQTIVGLRTTYAQPAGWDAIDRATRAAELSKTVMMLEYDATPGQDPRELLLRHIRPGDILTDVYSHKGLENHMWVARKKGILFDVGSLWFRIAVPAIKQNFLPDTISTDMDKNSIMLPRATMTNVMSKFLAMGMTLEQVIERTTVNPAKAIRRPDLGSIEEGGIADIAVLEMQTGRFSWLDSGHGKLTSDKELRCVLTVRNGAIVWDAEGLSVSDWRNAGPYTNFK